MKPYEKYSEQYGRIVIKEQEYEGNLVRMMLVKDGQESACFVDKKKKYDLVFDYTEKLDRVFSAMPDLMNTLMIGGGGFSYPKYYISQYPDRSMTVVELNPDMLELSKRFFYLTDLYSDYHLEETHRLEIYIDDGNHYLKHTERLYDAIINDAYLGNTLDRALQERSAIANIRKHLMPNGLYIINIITARQGTLAADCEKEQELLRTYFQNCILIPCDKREDPFTKQNCLLLASDRPLRCLFRYF